METKVQNSPSLIVTSANALIALANMENDEIHLLTGFDVTIIPDMVRHELAMRVTEPGAKKCLDFLREREYLIRIGSTETYEEFLLIQSLRPETAIFDRVDLNSRSEIAADELLTRELEWCDTDEIMMLFADGQGLKNCLREPPKNVTFVSLSNLLTMEGYTLTKS